MFQSYADRERGEVEHLLDDLSGSLDQIRSHVVGGIETQLDAVMTKGEGMVNRLEEELSLLTERRAALEAQATSQDHIAFLKVRTPAATDPRITTEALFITPLPPSDIRGDHGSSGRGSAGPGGRRLAAGAPLPAGRGEACSVRGQGEDGRDPDRGDPLTRTARIPRIPSRLL